MSYLNELLGSYMLTLRFGFYFFFCLGSFTLSAADTAMDCP